jgi:hypothetical protein
MLLNFFPVVRSVAEDCMEASNATNVSHLRLANAYGRPVMNVPKSAAELPRHIGPADADRVELTSRTVPAKVRNLVAGSVAQSVTFQGAPSTPSGAALPLYRHPADANAAATGVALGRTLDVQG